MPNDEMDFTDEVQTSLKPVPGLPDPEDDLEDEEIEDLKHEDDDFDEDEVSEEDLEDEEF
jgi:hypothetical protein